MAARIREHIRLAREFEAWVRADERFEVMAPAPFSVVCFRARFERLPPAEQDAANQRLMDAVNATGEVYLSHTRLRGRLALRLASATCARRSATCAARGSCSGASRPPGRLTATRPASRGARAARGPHQRGRSRQRRDHHHEDGGRVGAGVHHRPARRAELRTDAGEDQADLSPRHHARGPTISPGTPRGTTGAQTSLPSDRGHVSTRRTQHFEAARRRARPPACPCARRTRARRARAAAPASRAAALTAPHVLLEVDVLQHEPRGEGPHDGSEPRQQRQLGQHEAEAQRDRLHEPAGRARSRRRKRRGERKPPTTSAPTRNTTALATIRPPGRPSVVPAAAAAMTPEHGQHDQPQHVVDDGRAQDDPRRRAT